MFLLEKWYLDLVTADGSVLLLYAARLQWGGLRVNYASGLRSTAGGPPDERTTFRRTAFPRLAADRLHWANRYLGVEAEWRRDAAPIERTLTTSPAGSIDWSCRMPRAQAMVRWGETTYRGLGYAEYLRLSLPPGRLPFRTLHWGRHLSDRHTLVWIDWDGAEPRRWVWLDGIEQPGACLTAAGLTGLDGGRVLRLDAGRELRNRPVVGSLARFLPAIPDRVVGPVASMHEHKQLARSSLMAEGRPTDSGWAVHEEVRW